VYDMGYINDWAVPLTSAFLDTSRESTLGLLEQNPNLFTGVDGKSDMFTDWVRDPARVVISERVNSVPSLALKDYNHDRMLNGAYYSKPDDLLTFLDYYDVETALSQTGQGGYRTPADVELYHLQSGVDHQAYLADIGNTQFQNSAKLRYEPVFNLVANAFSNSAPHCGGAAGNPSIDMPRQNLCSSGIASPVTGSGPWHWTCDSIFAVDTVPCSTPVRNFMVTATAGSGGVITPASVTTRYGNRELFQVTPDAGYALDQISGCDGQISALFYTTGAISADCTISALFVPVTVRTDGSSGSREYAHIQPALDSAFDSDTVKLLSGLTYSENVTMRSSVVVRLSGGYSKGFAGQTSNSVISGNLVICKGKVIIDSLAVR